MFAPQPVCMGSARTSLGPIKLFIETGFVNKGPNPRLMPFCNGDDNFDLSALLTFGCEHFSSFTVYFDGSPKLFCLFPSEAN
jgi:hypothetical protein